MQKCMVNYGLSIREIIKKKKKQARVIVLPQTAKYIVMMREILIV